MLAALTGSSFSLGGAPGEAHHGAIVVPDERVERLSEIFQPKKTTHATLQLTDLVGAHGPLKKGELFTPVQVAHLRDMDLLVTVLRFFSDESIPHPLSRIDPAADLSLFLSECLLADMAVAEKRVDRIQSDLRKGGAGARKDDLEMEMSALERVRKVLEEERPVRAVEKSEREEKALKGFGFLTGKPIVPVANTGDLTSDTERQQLEGLVAEISKWNGRCSSWDLPEPLSVNAKLELELREMLGTENLDGEEAAEYYAEAGLRGPSYERIVRQAYQSLGLVSFLTVGEDEVRAWSAPHGCPAPKAAGTVHSDMEKGFIRAEIVAYDDFIQTESMSETRKQGKLRIEGKDYAVQDGDIICFRFSV